MILLLADICAYYAALFIAYRLRLLLEAFYPVANLQFSLQYFMSLWWILALILFSQLIFKLYHRRDPLWIESGKVLKSMALAFIIVFAIVSLGQMSGKISRLFLCLLWFIAPVIFIIFRVWAKKIMFRYEGFQMKALLIGDEKRLPFVARAFEDEHFMGIRIAAVIVLNSACDRQSIDRIMVESKIDAAIMAPPAGAEESFLKLFSHIHTRVRSMFYLPEPSALDLTNAETGQLLRSQQGYLLVHNALQSRLNRLVKRIFDLFVAVILTPIVLPVILLFMAVVRLTSPGPAIFSHERVGRDGKAFQVYKLRTMYKDAGERLDRMLAEDPAVKTEWESHYKLKDDPRITKVGKFLRKSSLDELPQFFNVFAGNMSFVGPRPVLKEELKKYYKDQAVYYCMATPGITGLWQVSGRSDVTYDDRVAIDSWYVFNWSLWLDIVILLSTPVAVMFRRGAY